jgi:hypothetical protein
VGKGIRIGVSANHIEPPAAKNIHSTSSAFGPGRVVPCRGDLHTTIAGVNMASKALIRLPGWLLASGLGFATPFASAQSFTRVADTSSAVPGGSGTFSGFGAGSAAPAISGSAVVFYGRDSGSGTPGVYTGTTAGGPLSVVADFHTVAPGQSGTFNFFYPGANSVSGSVVAFPGQVSTVHGVYIGSVTGGSLFRVVDSTTTLPGGGGTFTEPSATAISGTTVAFYSTTSGSGQGIYTATTGGGSLARMADTTTIVPGGSVPFTSFGGLTLSGSTVAFQGKNNGPTANGIYTGDVPTGTLTRIADFTTTIPVVGGTFGASVNAFGTPSVSGATVAFRGSGFDSGGHAVGGIYAGSTAGGSLIRVVDTSTTFPGYSGSNTAFNDPAISGTIVAFSLVSGNGTSGGIFYKDTSTGVLTRLVGLGDTLDGRTVSNLYLGPQGLDGGVLAFAADFTDLSHGVYVSRLTPVPEPGLCLGLGVIVLLVLAGYRWSI